MLQHPAIARCRGGRRRPAAHSGLGLLLASARPPHLPGPRGPPPCAAAAAAARPSAARSALCGTVPSRAEQSSAVRPAQTATPHTAPGGRRAAGRAGQGRAAAQAEPRGLVLRAAPPRLLLTWAPGACGCAAWLCRRQPGPPTDTGALCSCWAAAGPSPHLTPALSQALLRWLHCAPITPLIQDGGAPRTGFPLPLSTGCGAAQRWAREAATEPIAGKVPPPAGVAGREGKGVRRPRARTQLPPCAWHAPRGGRERGGRGGAAASPQAVLSPPQVGAGRGGATREKHAGHGTLNVRSEAPRLWR